MTHMQGISLERLLLMPSFTIREALLAQAASALAKELEQKKAEVGRLSTKLDEAHPSRSRADRDQAPCLTCGAPAGYACVIGAGVSHQYRQDALALVDDGAQ